MIVFCCFQGLYSAFAVALITVAISSAIIRSKLKKQALSEDSETPDEEPSAPPGTDPTPTVVYTLPSIVEPRNHVHPHQNYCYHHK